MKTNIPLEMQKKFLTEDGFEPWPIPDDWLPTIEWLDETLEALAPGYRIVQIKEKFGRLRFYYQLPDETPIAVARAFRALIFQTEEAIRHEGTAEGNVLLY
ncbi:hypothetical protein [Arthrobacter sp. NPDC089319]|uniref:hypothetical protein n=1 Tax=Arthrobacter sp. NPDC089319 TaxID=3155915 RepID=UPI0034453658